MINILLYKLLLLKPPLKELAKCGKLPLVFFMIGPYLVTTINGFEFRLLILEVMLIQRIALQSRSIVWLLLALRKVFISGAS